MIAAPCPCFVCELSTGASVADLKRIVAVTNKPSVRGSYSERSTPMKIVIHFRNTVKNARSLPAFRINDLRIYERETLGLYGLSGEQIETLVNLMTGVFCPEEGLVKIFGTTSRELEDESWFQFLENFGIYNPEHLLEEGSSVGENVAAPYRTRTESMEEPHLSASVLRLANLVELSITDLSRIMEEAGPAIRIKTRVARAVANRPSVVLLFNPTEGLSYEMGQLLLSLLKRTRRKLKYTLVAMTSDLWLLERIANRVVFLNSLEGTFVENRLRGWYHTIFPFLKPSALQLFQLSESVLRHGKIIKAAEERSGKY